jgi:hypothetical protein
MPPNESLPDTLHRQWDALRPDARRDDALDRISLALRT